jgi:hypothetical protein
VTVVDDTAVLIVSFCDKTPTHSNTMEKILKLATKIL